MARKVVNRKELRAEAEAAEAAEKKGTKKKAAKKKKKAASRSRSKSVADVRMKLFWGVFNQSLKRVAVFDFDQKESCGQKGRGAVEVRQVPALRAACQGSDRRVGAARLRVCQAPRFRSTDPITQARVTRPITRGIGLTAQPLSRRTWPVFQSPVRHPRRSPTVGDPRSW